MNFEHDYNVTVLLDINRKAFNIFKTDEERVLIATKSDLIEDLLVKDLYYTSACSIHVSISDKKCLYFNNDVCRINWLEGVDINNEKASTNFANKPNINCWGFDGNPTEFIDKITRSFLECKYGT